MMLTSSCARLARHGHTISTSCVAARAPVPAAAPGNIRPIAYQSHQRRHSSSSSSSSSKPSNSSDGSRGIPQQQDQQQQQPQSSTEDAPEAAQQETQPASSRTSRRKARDVVATPPGKAKEEVVMNLPSVPSTRDVHPADVAISAFFSLHRPISVTVPVPSLASNKSFETIFTPRAKSSIKPAEVIGTLSSAVESIEAAQQRAQEMHSISDGEESDLRAAVTAASHSNNPHHLDGPPNDSPLKFPSHLLSGRYQPFHPPAPPASTESSRIEAATVKKDTSTDELPSTTLKKSYSTILTILERTHTNGSKTYTARASPITSLDDSGKPVETTDESHLANVPTPASFLGRMQLRQERWEEFRRERMGEWKEKPETEEGHPAHREGGFDGMWAISVKRQRRLKMKKHKYKKLMRKTRNLRRRLEKN